MESDVEPRKTSGLVSERVPASRQEKSHFLRKLKADWPQALRGALLELIKEPLFGLSRPLESAWQASSEACEVWAGLNLLQRLQQASKEVPKGSLKKIHKTAGKRHIF